MKTTFKEIKVGQEFFDPESGDVYIKRFEDTAERLAVMGDAWSGEMDEFEPDDEVDDEPHA